MLGHREKVDMWSAGTILYTMLAGYQPFNTEKYVFFWHRG